MGGKMHFSIQAGSNLNTIHESAIVIPEKQKNNVSTQNKLIIIPEPSTATTPFSVPHFINDIFPSILKCKFKSVAIPFSLTTLGSKQLISNIVNSINAEENVLFLNHILSGKKRPEKIIFFVKNKADKDTLSKALRRTRSWSKARKLNLLLDFLNPDYSRKELRKAHFISNTLYPGRIRKFYEELNQELNENIKQKMIDQYKKTIPLREIANAFEFIRYFNDLVSLYNKSRNTIKLIIENEFRDELPPGYSTFSRKNLKTIDPLFLSLKHLIPEGKWNCFDRTTAKWSFKEKEEFEEMGRREQRSFINKKYGIKAKGDPIEIMRDAAKEDAIYLKNIIIRTREVLRYTDLPVEQLKDFWGTTSWRKIMTWDQNKRIDMGIDEVIEDLLRDHYPINIEEALNPHNKEKAEMFDIDS